MEPFNTKHTDVHLSPSIIPLNTPSISTGEAVIADIGQAETTSAMITIKTGRKQERLDTGLLLYIKSCGKYTELHFLSGKRLLRISICRFMTEYADLELLRVNKSFAVNADFIDSFTASHLIVARHKIPLSRCYREDVFLYLRPNRL